MRIAVAALLLLASPLSFEAYAQDVEVMPLNESLSAIREAVNGDAGGEFTDGSDSRAWADFFQGLSIETQGLLPAEVEVVLHVVAVQSKGGGWSVGIPLFRVSSTGSPDWTQGSNTLTVKFRNAAFAKSDELIFQSVMRGTGTAPGDEEEQ